MRPSRADPACPGFSVSRSDAPTKLRLVALCGIEAYPGADGLLYGQRSYRTVYLNYICSLFFQDGVHARRQFTGYRHNGFAGGYLLGMTLIDAAIESAQVRIFVDRYPGALNQLVPQTAVAATRNRTAIFLVAGGVLAGNQAQKTSDLSHIADLPPVSQAGQRMGDWR
jgi:hypothetical protein